MPGSAERVQGGLAILLAARDAVLEACEPPCRRLLTKLQGVPSAYVRGGYSRLPRTLDSAISIVLKGKALGLKRKNP
jgi:hypothetical protein